MPGLSGLELAREFAALRADLPVILVSGNASFSESELPALGIASLVPKPFSAARLGQALDRALAQA